MKLISSVAALLALTSLASAVYAQDVIAVQNTPWKGFYMGGNIGGAWNHTCSSWDPGPDITGNPELATKFYNRDCPNNDNFIGGIDLGYNFQYDQWVWGFKADYDAVGSKSNSRSLVYTPTGPADPIPAGTYTASGKVTPNGIFLLGPRIGYAVDQWLPYFRVGGALLHSPGRHGSQQFLQRRQELQVQRLQRRLRNRLRYTRVLVVHSGVQLREPRQGNEFHV